MSKPTSAFVVQIIPAHSEEPPGLHTLETLMQSLTLPEATVGLELVWRSQGPQVFLRAGSETALQQMTHALQACYPQAQVRRVAPDDDPLHLREHEAATALELRVQGAAYERLRAWPSTSWRSPQDDPMFTLLSAGAGLPARVRLVSQLVLTPLPPTWRRRYTRLALEHPAEQERERRRSQLASARTSRDPGWGRIVGMGLLVLLLSLWQAGQLERFVPAWVFVALGALLRGQPPQVTSEQRVSVIGAAVLLGIVVALLAAISRLIAHALQGTPTLYDPKQIAEKLSKSAYRGCMRLVAMETLAPASRSSFPPAPRRRSHSLLGGLSHWPLQFVPRWLFKSYYTLFRMVDVPGLAQRVTALGWMVLSTWRSHHQRRTMHRDLLALLVAAYGQYQTATLRLHPRRLSRGQTRRWLAPSKWTAGIRQARWVLTAEEVALLWHPLSLAVPGMEQRQERMILAPASVTRGAGWKVGISEQAGMQAEVFYPDAALRQHAFVVGRTGKGKSTLFHHLALAQLDQRQEQRVMPGLCVIEPHGDLIAALLRTLPAHLSEEVILLDLANRETPAGLNLLDVSSFWRSPSRGEVEREVRVSAALMTLRSIWASSWGSRIENVMRYSLNTLMQANLTLLSHNPMQGAMQQYSLLDIVPLLQLSAFRRRVLDLVTDPFVHEWWHTYYERLDTLHQQDIITPILTKISAYASSSTARRIIGQPCSTLDFDALIATSGLLLVNTAAGQVGADVSGLLGATLLSLFTASLARQFALPEAEVRPFLTLVDEFHSYPVDYGYLLTGLRKAGLSLVLAAQSLAQLDHFDPTLRQTVLGNSEQKFLFTLAGEDAFLLRHDLSSLRPEDVVALPDYTCYALWSQNRHRLPPFSFQLARPPVGDEEQERQIRTWSALRDGRPQALVDDLLTQAHALHHPAPPTRRAGGGTPPPKPVAHGAAAHPPLHASASSTPCSEPSVVGGARVEAGAASTTHHKRARTRKQPFSTGNGSRATPGSSESLLQAQQSPTEAERLPPPLLP
jgi:hypothetical protein